MRVVFAPEVEKDLYGLIKILVEKEYSLDLELESHSLFLLLNG